MIIRALSLLLLAGPAVAFQGSWRDDREIANDLRQNGVSREREHSIAYFGAGTLPDEKMDAFSELLERGVTDIGAFAGVALPDRKITYFVSDKIDISHSRGRSVYLPLDRVRTRAAPYLHETAHSLLPCDDCSTWLSEGYASYVQSYISEHIGGYDGQIFTRNGNAGVDRDARRWQADPRGQAMVPYVGTELEEPDLSDRRAAAAPFYILSQSLVKYLVETTGTKDVRALAAMKDLPALREKWLARLKGPV